MNINIFGMEFLNDEISHSSTLWVSPSKDFISYPTSCQSMIYSFIYIVWIFLFFIAYM